MNSYIFVVGRTFDLCVGELRQVLGNEVVIENITHSAVFVTSPKLPDTLSLIDRLGGTIKIAAVVGSVDRLNPSLLTQFLTPGSSTFTFGISLYGKTSVSLSQLLHQMKDVFQTKSTPVRFVMPGTGQELSSVVIKKQHVVELILAFHTQKNSWIVGKTEAVQDVDMWSRRDFGRPFADPKRGMLPVKAARMMVNLALPVSRVTYQVSNLTMLDPFCGMGTILGEALLTGWHVVGNDQSSDAVTKAQKNLEWLISISRLIDVEKRMTLFVSDATHVSQKIAPETIDAIVTEPFMGTVFSSKGRLAFGQETQDAVLVQKGKLVTKKQVQNTLKGLEKLYIGSLKDWFSILKPGGRIVMAFPEIEFEGKKYSVKKVIDTCENLGYTLTLGPLEYSRPQAVVKRKIYVFKKFQNSKLKT